MTHEPEGGVPDPASQVQTVGEDLRAERLRWDLAIDAAGIGSFELVLDGERLTYDDRLKVIFGYPVTHEVTRMAEFWSRVHPADRERVSSAIQQAVDTRGEYRAEYVVVRPDGTRRWVSARGRVLTDDQGTPVRMLGAAYDVSETVLARQAEEVSAHRLKLLADVTGELGQLLDVEQAVGRLAHLVVPLLGAFAIVTVVDDTGLRDLGSAHVDPHRQTALQRYSHLRLQSLLPTSFLQRALTEGRTQLIATGATEAITAVLASPDTRDLIHQLAPTSLLVVPMKARGRTVGALSLFGHAEPDAGLQRAAEEVAARAGLALDNARAYAHAREARAAAEATAERLDLLSRVGSLLDSDLSHRPAVHDLARLVSPVLADWCVVIVPAVRGLRRAVGWVHAVEALTATVADLVEQTGRDAPWPPGTAAMAGQETLLEVVTPELLDAWLPGPEGRRQAAALAVGSMAVLPMNAGSRTLGVLALVRGTDRGPLSGAELDTAREVAARAGVALDIARLYGRQRDVAETLQTSLLTDVPQLDGFEVAARYVPAADQAQVGGDWYDAFRQPDGAVMMVVGDVVGHDSRAAAAMGQVRSLLRAIAWTTGEGPAGVLQRLDEALEGLDLPVTATTVVVRLVGLDDPDDPSRVSMTWSSAGHLPPVLLTRDGSVTLAENARADLLLGVDPQTSRQEGVAVLDRGTTVLLYTDGLVEQRGASIDDGIEALRLVAADLVRAPVPVLCDTLISRLRPHSPDDDIALLAVRIEGSGGWRRQAGGVVTREIVLGGEPMEVRRARHFVQDLVGDMCGDLADTVVLLTSELVTNAIIHGRSEARVQVTTGDARVRVEVADENSRPPAIQVTDDEALDGRGLMILTTVADDWGVYPAGIGKVVWFEVACHESGHPHAV